MHGSQLVAYLVPDTYLVQVFNSIHGHGLLIDYYSLQQGESQTQN